MLSVILFLFTFSLKRLLCVCLQQALADSNMPLLDSNKRGGLAASSASHAMLRGDDDGGVEDLSVARQLSYDAGAYDEHDSSDRSR